MKIDLRDFVKSLRLNSILVKDASNPHSYPEKIEVEKGAKEEPSGIKKFKAEPNKKFLHELHTCKKSINQMKLIRFMASKASRHFF